MDTLGLQQQVEAALIDCKLLTPTSIAACITTLADSVAAEIKDCGNTITETSAFLKLLWNDVKDLSFDQ